MCCFKIRFKIRLYRLQNKTVYFSINIRASEKDCAQGRIARHDNWGGRGIFIYSCLHTVKTIDFKRNPSGRTRIYEVALTSNS